MTSLQAAITITRPGWKQPIYATEQSHPSSLALDQCLYEDVKFHRYRLVNTI